LRESGFLFLLTYELAVFGEVCLKAGQAQEELRALNEKIDLIRQPGRRFYESEFYRLRAELAVMQTPEDLSLAETDIRQAIDIARRQYEKSHELRALMSAYRLAQKQGGSTKAHALLCRLYDSFTEGHDTPDLMEAKALFQST
jgi:predicted ATPase